jgi:Novel STAND NTPase 1
MLAHSLNPFRYGKPVPPDRFIGREDARRTVFARINNGESTAIVGEPHIGKSSFLRYIRDERTRRDWLGDEAVQYAFVDIDCHMLPSSFQPADFWQEIVGHVEEAFPGQALRRPTDVAHGSGYASFALKRLFDTIGRKRMRAVVMVDEFDVLLHHDNFNTAEFFGALRALAIQTDGLVLLTASRMMVAEMNRRSQEINPLGSPFFNNLIEVRLLPLRPDEVDHLIDQTLAGTRMEFSSDDRGFIVRASGRHPFLVQIAAAALYDAIAQNVGPQARYAEAERSIQGWAAVHFEDVWQRLSPELKRVSLILALAEFPQPGAPVPAAPLDDDDREMRWLADGGLIETTEDSRHALWRGERWRIGAGSFARWLTNSRKWLELRQLEETSSSNRSERAQQIAAIREQLAIKRRRLAILEEQAATYGLIVPPAVTMQIQDTQREIAEDERELRRLGGHV